MSAARESIRDQLYDFAVDCTDGFTVHEAMKELRVPYHAIRAAIKDLRDLLGDTDEIWLTCNPDPIYPGGQWKYELVGKFEDMRQWHINRLNDTETRLRTQQGSYEVSVRVTDGRTTEGKKARAIAKGVRRMIEDLDDIIANNP